MQILTRGLPYEMPKYSLTGDILSFQRCGLQYRYYNGSSLPPSRPVQLWTGEFVHNVLEDAYQIWKEIMPTLVPFPWPCNPTPWPSQPLLIQRTPRDIGIIGDVVEGKLRAGGKTPRSINARNAAYRRVNAAVNLIGPYLFPLITYVEKKVSGTRGLISPINGQGARSDRYELVGVADVISSIQLGLHNGNPIVELIKSNVDNLSNEFDIVVDYKAARRPSTKLGQWDHHNWQIQTYSWLRAEQPNTNVIRSGIVIYINELSPSADEIKELKKEILRNETDVKPITGSADYYALNTWQEGSPCPNFTENFLLNRALRIVPVTTLDINNAVSEIDRVVTEIETCVLNENSSGNILTNWGSDGIDKDCDACDFRRFCPNPANRRTNPQQFRNVPPMAPG
jgi:hypothetical protein